MQLPVIPGNILKGKATITVVELLMRNMPIKCRTVLLLLQRLPGIILRKVKLFTDGQVFTDIHYS